VYNNSTGAVTISGGTVQTTTGCAVYNNSTGAITVSGTAKISSANTAGDQGTIYLKAPTTDNTDQRLGISGGTVENTGANGRAIYSASTGGITISGGTVQATGSGTVYAVYNSSSGITTVTAPPAVIVGLIYPSVFTSIPILTLEPGSGTITYRWTTPNPSADSYDVYWKEGNNLTAADVKTGTKITGAASGGSISGLTNGTAYSVIVTANKASHLSRDSVVMTAIPGISNYIITGSSGAFTATKGGVTVGTAGRPIQDVIDAIKTDTSSSACFIHFGDGIAPLETGTSYVSFNNTSGNWGSVTLGGKITASLIGNNGTITLAGNVSINSGADIANTGNLGYAVYNNGTGTLTISGGTVSATANTTVYNYSTGTVTITGGTVVSAGTNAAVSNYSTGWVNISGGTVQGATGNAVLNSSTGRITVSGTAVVTTAATSTTYAAINTAGSSSDGGVRIQINGGTVSNTSSGRAVYNNSQGEVKITGGMVQAGTGGVAVINGGGVVTISGGTVQATTNYAVNNSSTGMVTISGGTVQATTSSAVYNNSTGPVLISGGTVSATTGYAVNNYAEGKITVRQDDAFTPTIITSANTTADQGTIILRSSGTATAARLEITGGTVRNTSTGANGNAIYNASTGAITMNGTGTTISTTATSGRAIFNNSTGAFTMSNGTVSVTGTSARAIHNQSTGAITINNGAVTAPVNGTAYSIYNNSTGVVTVNGGTITGARYP
jgi:hypothetical protein